MFATLDSEPQTAARVAWNSILKSIERASFTVRLLILFSFILLFILVVLLIVALTRQTDEIDGDEKRLHRTKHLSAEIIGYGTRPMLPLYYTNMLQQHFDLVIVAGDSSAAGHGVLGRDTDSWIAALGGLITTHLSKNAPQIIVLAKDYSNINGLQAQLQSLATVRYPGGIPGRVAIVVQSGAEDVISCADGTGPQCNSAADVAGRLVQTIYGVLSAKNNSHMFLDHQPQVYLLDYPDATTGTGYIAPGQLSCKVGLNIHFDAFNLFSVALGAHAKLVSYVHIPLRYVLARHGAQRSMVLEQTDSVMDKHDVFGNTLQNGALEYMFADCFFLGEDGQRYQAQLVWAYLSLTNYYQLY